MTSKRQSRRTFLQAAGATAAVGAANLAGFLSLSDFFGWGPAQGQPYVNLRLPNDHTAFHPAMKHLVVLMGENRSFDNLLGHLYTPDTLPAGKTFEGLAFDTYSNTSEDGTVYPAHTYHGSVERVMMQPSPDPGEEYPHINTQLFDTVLPSSNALKSTAGMRPPYNAPADTSTPTMSGFVRDYANKFKRLRGVDPTPEQLRVIMGGFAPDQLPVLSTLAKQFGVFDHWFAAVPSQTYCNRSFFNAATSHGYVNNQTDGGYDKWIYGPKAPTIFNRLEEAGLSWRIYYDALQLVSMTGLIHAPVLEQFWHTDRFATMEQFYEDAANGTLPAYAFIEPRLVYNHNDFHPPVGPIRESEVDGFEVYNGGVSDVRAGEELVHNVYSAIRNSSTTTGSNHQNTALLITFDEPGGTYDHVPPPSAVPPDVSGPGEMGFTFDRLGCRIPAILVSAFIEPGSIFNQTMNASSVVATLSTQYGLKPLTNRDAQAPVMFPAFNRADPRPSSEWPVTKPLWQSPNPEAVPHPADVRPDHPLSEPAKGILGLLYARFGTEAEKRNVPQTFAEAYNALDKYGEGLFGVAKKS